MNYDNVLAVLFPGAAGRTIAELVRLHAAGRLHVSVEEAASGASVAPGQVRKIGTRLALLGLVELPVVDDITLITEHIIWSSLRKLADPQDEIDRLAADTVVHSNLSLSDVVAVAVGGPVAEGTATGYPDQLEVEIVCREPLRDETIRSISAAISRGIGNACSVRVASELGAPVDGVMRGSRVVYRRS